LCANIQVGRIFSWQTKVKAAARVAAAVKAAVAVARAAAAIARRHASRALSI